MISSSKLWLIQNYTTNKYRAKYYNSVMPIKPPHNRPPKRGAKPFVIRLSDGQNMFEEGGSLLPSKYEKQLEKYHKAKIEQKQKLRLVAEARKEILEFIGVIKHQRGCTRALAIDVFVEKVITRRIPPHLIDAIHIAHRSKRQFGSVNVSRPSLYRWFKDYEAGDYQISALEPKPTKAMKRPKKPYSNDN